jgi:ADP-ribose pyrophosphatase YjhB (NUDIX family)
VFFLWAFLLLKNAGGYGIVIFDKRSEEKHMNDRLLDYATRIQSIAQAGLQYGKDKYDRERYEELRQIAAEMISEKTEIPMEKVRNLFCNETGYQTPKIDTRAAVFIDGKILLVHENNGTWCLPGGWCDVDQSIASNTEKEVREESGFTVTAQRLIAVQDWRKHNVTNYVYGVVKCFVLCKYEGGEFQENIETTEIGLFGRDEIPHELAVEKTSREQILMCFDALDDPLSPTLFD